MATTVRPVEPSAEIASRGNSFQRLAWLVLAWNVLVVLWGAYVRASGSGAGCGSHWPLCNGEVVPQAPQIATIIEFTHRVTSGIALVLVVGLYFLAMRKYSPGHAVRRSAALGIVFMITEALLGAGLVLFRYVEKDESLGRALYLSAHLINTMLLLGVLAMTAFYAASPTPRLGKSSPGRVFATLPIALAVSVTGAIAALGDTLYPASSLAAGMRQEMSATASLLVRLRVIHPALAILSGIFIFATAILAARQLADRRIAFAAATLTALQLGLGALNVVLLAPVWMQIVHLLVADMVWISLVFLWLNSRRVA